MTLKQLLSYFEQIEVKQSLGDKIPDTEEIVKLALSVLRDTANDETYQEGYNDGYSNGYDDGYEKGEETGLEQAYERMEDYDE